jgi:TRAP-type C4-dicarboxylate transport system substrate-binding protein
MGPTAARIAQVTVLMIIVGGCAGGGIDKAGGREADPPTVLTMVKPGGVPAGIQAFVDSVDRLSGGTIRFEYDEDIWLSDDPEQERHLIEGVQAGKVDVAWFGARALDSFGVTSFQAMLAPFLVDSYELQDRIFEAGIPTRMLDGVQGARLVGIGVLPGLLRKLMGMTQPFETPSDFDGAVVGTSGGELAIDTFEALGATPKRVPSPTTLDGLDALDYPLPAILGGRYYLTAQFVMANLNFWPRPFVIVMNPDSFAALTEHQREILRTAASEAVTRMAQSDAEDEVGARSGLCATGTGLVTLDAAEQAALAQAVEPLYARLESSAETRAFLDEIRGLKEQLNMPADSFDCPDTQRPTDSARTTPIDGVYRTTTTYAEGIAAGDPQPIPENYGDWVLVFDRGRFADGQENGEACTWAYGTYVVDGDRLELTFSAGGGYAPNGAYNKPGEQFVYGWSRYRDTLTFEPVEGEISHEGFTIKPWRATGESPAPSVFPERCPPPSEALSVS